MSEHLRGLLGPNKNSEHASRAYASVCIGTYHREAEGEAPAKGEACADAYAGGGDDVEPRGADACAALPPAELGVCLLAAAASA